MACPRRPRVFCLFLCLYVLANALFWMQVRSVSLTRHIVSSVFHTIQHCCREIRQYLTPCCISSSADFVGVFGRMTRVIRVSSDKANIADEQQDPVEVLSQFGPTSAP